MFYGVCCTSNRTCKKDFKLNRAENECLSVWFFNPCRQYRVHLPGEWTVRDHEEKKEGLSGVSLPEVHHRWNAKGRWALSRIT